MPAHALAATELNETVGQAGHRVGLHELCITLSLGGREQCVRFVDVTGASAHPSAAGSRRGTYQPMANDSAAFQVPIYEIVLVVLVVTLVLLILRVLRRRGRR